MKIAMMQPYIFPSISYWQLLSWADIFVSLECVNYIKKGWINRNRLLHPDSTKKFRFITMPVQGASQNKKIADVSVVEGNHFFSDVREKIKFHKTEAPFITETLVYLEEVESLVCGVTKICDINTAIIEDLAVRLELDCRVIKDSSLDFDISDILRPQDWAIEITSALNGTEYANPIGGADLYHSSDFASRGIELKFLKSESPPYEQGGRLFEDRLSIIDVLLWNGCEKTRQMMNAYSLVSGELG